MTDVHIHQIAYSEETRASRDPGFAELDNMDNPRPDWREYWPMRQYLLTQPLDEDALYGFFSPKFEQKTNLKSAQVYSFIAANPGADVYIFSPYIDQCSFFLNVFEQGEANHPGMLAISQKVVDFLGLGVDVRGLLMNSANTIYCNYFVARPAFWRAWLEVCERLFAEGERGGSEVAGILNGHTTHDHYLIPMKVHVIERMASLILATQPHWRTRTYDPYVMTRLPSAIAGFEDEFVQMDALKLAYAQTGLPAYFNAYAKVRTSLLQRVGLRK